MKKHLQKNLKSYLATAGALIASAANAQVVYTDISPDTMLTMDGHVFELDLDGNNVDDFKFSKYMRVNEPDTNSGNNVIYNSVELEIYGKYNSLGLDNQVMVTSATFFYTTNGVGGTYSTNIPKLLNNNDYINNNGGFVYNIDFIDNGSYKSTGGNNYASWKVQDVWKNQITKFVGLRIPTGVSDTLYGWVRVSIDNDYNMTIHDYAYQSTVNTPIQAGEGAPAAVLVSGITVDGVNSVDSIVVNNGTLQMEAAILPANATNKSVVWSVTNGTGQATINATTGLLSAQSDGTVTVKATANDGSNINGTIVVNIKNQGVAVLVTGITVDGTGGASTITVDNGTLQMTTAVLPANADDKTVTWSVTNGTGQATISASGLLTAVADGTVTVKATANDGSNVNGTKVVTISNQSAAVLVTGITVTGAGSATTITTAGGTLQMSEAVLPANASNKAVTWSVSNGTGEATISVTGLLTAVKDGTVTVKATANDGSNISGTLEVIISNQSNSIAENEMEMVSIYPNPVVNSLNIITPESNASYTILNSFGKIVLNGKLSSTENKLDVSSLENGVYFLDITAEGKTTYRKFIKN